MPLVTGTRQKTQLELAFPAAGRGEAPRAAGGGTAPVRAGQAPESPASTERLVEEVCGLENLKRALRRVKANKGSPGVDGMAVAALPAFTAGKEPKRRIASKALEHLKTRVRELTGRSRRVHLERRVGDLRRYLVGWREYFGLCQTPSVLQDLDSWIRRRLRCVVWKQGKRGRTRFRELRRRGIGEGLAACTAGSPHGPWRLSRSPALSYALPGAYFRTLGLPRLGPLGRRGTR